MFLSHLQPSLFISLLFSSTYKPPIHSSSLYPYLLISSSSLIFPGALRPSGGGTGRPAGAALRWGVGATRLRWARRGRAPAVAAGLRRPRRGSGGRGAPAGRAQARRGSGGEWARRSGRRGGAPTGVTLRRPRGSCTEWARGSGGRGAWAGSGRGALARQSCCARGDRTGELLASMI
jgi:hypothetical protein